MKLFSEKVNPTLTNSSLNILTVENFHEIFFDVYEIELNKKKYPVEKISSYKGNPVVAVPVSIGENTVEYPFVLMKGAPDVVFNENNTEHPLDLQEESQKIEVDTFESPDLEYESRITEEAKTQILNQIEFAKKQAIENAEKIKLQKIKEADLEIKAKNKLLQETLKSAKQQLVEEFITISESIKKELLGGVDSRYSEISDTVDNKIKYLADNLSESINSDFENSEKRFEKNIKEFVKSLHNTTVLPELKKQLHEISESIVDKISNIEANLDEKLTEKVDLSVIEEISSELSAIRDSNLELNNNINKGVNRALSRIGNVNTKIDEVSENLIKQVDEKISTTASEITEYYSEKLKELEDQTFNLNETSRKYVIDLVEESRNALVSEIRKIQKEAPVELVIESSGKKQVKSLDVIEKDINKKIADKIADEVVKLRKYVAVYSSGGGSVAQQFANGGVMNGNLTIVGTISASQYLGLSAGGGGGGVSGDYLPLSGGTITGSLSVFDGLSANSLNLTNGINISNTSGGITIDGITNAFGAQNQFNSQIRSSAGVAMVFRNVDVVCERETFYVGGLDGSGTVYGNISGGSGRFGTLTVSGPISADSSSGTAHEIVGNINLTGTGSNQFNATYANTITLNGNSGINLNTTSGSINLSSGSGVDISSASGFINLPELIKIGGTSASFPSIKRNGSGIDIRDAADTSFTDLKAANITASSTLSASSVIITGGTAGLSATRDSIRQKSTVSTDLSATSTTFISTGLSVSLIGGLDYLIRGMFDLDSTTNSFGSKLQLSMSQPVDTLQASGTNLGIQYNAAAAPASVNLLTTTRSDFYINATANSYRRVNIDIRVRLTATGTVSVSFGQQATGGTPATVLRAGSFLTAELI
jgi:hypothetical protein